ncbi:MAG: transposase [Crocosphaera sp.]
MYFLYYILKCGIWDQWLFEYLWLYGLIEPKTGNSFFYEFSHLDTPCFEKFLELFSQQYPDEVHIIQLDNGRGHLGLDLSIPNNVILLFQLPTHLELNSRWKAAVHSAPPYCPEVNPIERFWKEVKKFLKNKVFDSLDFLRRILRNILAGFSQKDIASITGYDFILEALSIAGL